MKRMLVGWFAPRNNPALPACLLLLGTLLVFTPALIFQGNEPFFTNPLFEILAYLVPLWLVLSVVLAIPALGGEGLRQRIFTRAVSGLAIAVWVHATFAVGTEGMLDGATFRIADAPMDLARNLIGFLIVIVLVFWVAGRWAQLVRLFVTALVALLFLSAVYVAATVRTPERKPASATGFASMSKQTNVLLILFDGFQSDLFVEMMEREPAIAKQLDGFTFFPDTATTAYTTSLALPSIHSGQPWSATEPVKAFVERTIGESSVLSAIVRGGYDGLLVNPLYKICPKDVTCLGLSDIVVGRTGSWFLTAGELIDLSLLRALPHVAKPLVLRKGEWLFSGGAMLRATETHLSNLLLDRLGETLDTAASKPTLKFLHLVNTHTPARVSADCTYIGKADWTRETAGAQARCAMTHFLGLLDKLKRADLFDNTAIVLFADHGTIVPRNGLPVVLERANPVLLVKPQKATGPLASSKASASIADLPATWCALSKACQWPTGNNVMTLRPDTQRERYFTDYKWRSEYYWQDKPFPIRGRYVIRGPVLDIASWESAPSSPVPPVQRVPFGPADPAAAFGPGWEDAGKDAPRWVAAASAILWVNVPPGGTGKVSARVATHKGNPDQQMEITVAGQRVFHGRVAPGTPQELAFQLPQSALKGGRVALRFRFTQWNPAKSQDKERPLAVAFHSLEVQ
ncbi:MAG TPA: sulfatase-like hydrolase/transferase [bacterium]